MGGRRPTGGISIVPEPEARLARAASAAAAAAAAPRAASAPGAAAASAGARALRNLAAGAARFREADRDGLLAALDPLSRAARAEPPAFHLVHRPLDFL